MWRFKCAFHWKTLVAAVMYSQLNSIILDYPFCRVVAIIVSYASLNQKSETSIQTKVYIS
jgi:hypothetical protein